MVGGLRTCQVRKHLASHVLGVLGVPGVLARPLENEIPCGRSAHWKRHSLRAGRPLEAAGNEWQLVGGRGRHLAASRDQCLGQDTQDTQDTQDGAMEVRSAEIGWPVAPQ